MHKIEAPGATQDNRFTEGDPSSGVPATELSAAFMNAVQDELITFVAAAGISPKTAGTETGDQLLAAFRALEATTSQRGTVEKATTDEAKSGAADKHPDAAGVKAALDDRIADQAAVDSGTNDVKFVTPKKLKAWVKQATEAVAGMLKVATQAQTDAGTDDATAITPKKLRWGFDVSFGQKSYIILPSWLGGLIIQFGYATGLGSSNAYTTSLPVALPNAIKVALAIDNSVHGDPDGIEGVSVSTDIYTQTTEVRLTKQGVVGALSWFVIGH